MQRNVVIGLITLLLVAAGIALYFFLPRPESKPNSEATSTEPTVGGSTTPASSSVISKSATLFPSNLVWGAYVGDGEQNLPAFESLVGKKVNILADFEGWQNEFPSHFKNSIGVQGKTLLIFWEPDFGYDTILNGSQDMYIRQFAADAKAYGYPVILIPFDEMNLNEEAWQYGNNGNSGPTFIAAWKHVHDLFAGVSNVKFGLAYNNISIPDISGNRFADYYPGDQYVDYVGVDGFNFDNPYQSFDQIFDSAISNLQQYKKPIYIFSMGSVSDSRKAAWITEGLGTHIKTYPNLAGWIWFNENDTDNNTNWLVNSDPQSLQAFKTVTP